MSSLFLVRTVVEAVLLWGAALVFLLPLTPRPGRTQRLVLWLFLFLGLHFLLAFAYFGMGLPVFFLFLLSRTCQYALLTVMFYFCADLRWFGAAYAAVWGFSLILAASEGFCLATAFFYPGTLTLFQFVSLRLVSAVPLYLLLGVTLARSMPENGVYRVGPRQFASAVLLAGLHAIQYHIVLEALADPERLQTLLLPALIAQLYCATLLYLQTELFKKSAMQKELDILNLVHLRQQEQYKIARQNVWLINRRCHELKRQMAAMRRSAPDEATRQTLLEAEKAVQIYDAMASTGNEVLDVVLAEKQLLCEARDIQINCVADGACLSFLEPSDLYALFSGALDNAIDAVFDLSPGQRVIDLLVCKRQNFLVINIINPAPGPLSFRDGLPVSQKSEGLPSSHGLRALRGIVREYQGALTVDHTGGFFAFKAVIPIPGTNPDKILSVSKNFP